MKVLIGAMTAVVGLTFSATMALANPALLPQHEGYPMKNDGSPVTGQPTANDPGKKSGGGSEALQTSADSTKHAQQQLMDPNNNRIVEKQGAGRLPVVQGPQIKIEPPVKEATRMPK